MGASLYSAFSGLAVQLFWKLSLAVITFQTMCLITILDNTLIAVIKHHITPHVPIRVSGIKTGAYDRVNIELRVAMLSAILIV